jgi:hypothetical protein
MSKDFSTSINLLTPARKPGSEVDSILNWVLQWGRFITLGSCAFLVGVFAYRVYIDTKRSVVEEDLADKYTNVERTIEKQRYYSAIQNILNDVSTLQEEQEKVSDRTFIFSEYLYDNKELKNFSMNYKSVEFDLVFADINKMYEVESSMKKDSRIDNEESQFKVKENSEGSEAKVKGTIFFVESEENEALQR